MKTLIGQRLLNVCFLFLFLIISSSGFAQLARAPDWVLNTPVNDNAFYGLGTASFKDNDQFRTQARKMALKEIVEKIFISINSSSEYNLTYVNERVEYVLDETTTTETSSFISGHIKVDDWIDKRANKYYVLYRLDKVTYLRNRRAYFEGLDKMSVLMGGTANELIHRGEYLRGIRKLEEHILFLENILERPIEPEYQVQFKKTQLATIYQLEEQISRINFNVENSYDFFVDQPLVIKDYVVDRITGRPITGLKAKVVILEGDVFNYSFDHYNNTDELLINGVFPVDQDAEIQLKVKLPLSEETIALLDPELGAESLSSPIRFRFKPYSIYFDSYETNGNGSESSAVLTQYLRTITEDLGLEERESSDAFYRIKVSSERNSNKSGYGVYYSEYSGKVEVFRNFDDRKVYSFDLDEKVAKSGKRNLANQRAFDLMLKENKTFLLTFVTFLCSYQED